MDSVRYTRIRVVQTSVQSLRANYFGRYIAAQIDAIPIEEITEAHEGRFPTVLVVGPGQYLRQVCSHLEANGYQCGGLAPANRSRSGARRGLPSFAPRVTRTSAGEFSLRSITRPSTPKRSVSLLPIGFS